MIAVAIAVSVVFVTITDVVIIYDCTDQLYCFVDSNIGYILDYSIDCSIRISV